MPRIIALAAVLAALALAGCNGKKPKYPTCEKDKDCKAGEHCVNKKCVQCAESSDCEDGEVCRNGACQKPDGWCASDDDCTDGKVCKNNACVACSSDVECGAGGRCQDGGCLRKGQCKVDEDCADDEDCVNGRCTKAGTGQPGACQLPAIYFDFDQAAINAENQAKLEQINDCLKSTDRGVRVIGHTDPRGTEEYNIALSEGRARSVADYLARLGVDPARFHLVPKGEAEATGTDEGSWREDRRVEFEWQ
jgi:peptidoglycan-associated lipoprotein